MPVLTSRRAWLVWTAAMGVYVLAVLHRSSLGVAGILAADRFEVDATRLSLFTVLQLVVYAGMQVPVGVLLDRYGSRVLLVGGLVLMTTAQFTFALTTSFPVAVAARGVLGAGDAMVFISVIRLVVLWFSPGRVPMVTQVTGWGGQLGAILAATPLTVLLDRFGWTSTFGWISSVGVLLLVVVLLWVRDSPEPSSPGAVGVPLRELAASVRLVWHNPGTQLGLWSHFVSQFAYTVFALLWGFPFLVRGQGWSELAAGNLMVAMTAWVVVSGFLLGTAISRWPWYRTWLVVGLVGLMASLWTAVLLHEGPAPRWLVVVTALATSTGGPLSMVGFDLARTFTRVRAFGRANGIVNVGGFVASLCTMGLMGIVLDLREPDGMEAYTNADFRAAFCVMYLFWAIGVVQVLRARRRAVAHLRAEHPGAVEALKAGHGWTLESSEEPGV